VSGGLAWLCEMGLCAGGQRSTTTTKGVV
jgi:hypothetical protein